MDKPTKEQVRAYTQRRSQSKAPPPSPEQIRQDLGWRFTTKPR